MRRSFHSVMLWEQEWCSLTRWNESKDPNLDQPRGQEDGACPGCGHLRCDRSLICALRSINESEQWEKTSRNGACKSADMIQLAGFNLWGRHDGQHAENHPPHCFPAHYIRNTYRPYRIHAQYSSGMLRPCMSRPKLFRHIDAKYAC